MNWPRPQEGSGGVLACRGSYAAAHRLQVQRRNSTLRRPQSTFTPSIPSTAFTDLPNDQNIKVDNDYYLRDLLSGAEFGLPAPLPATPNRITRPISRQRSAPRQPSNSPPAPAPLPTPPTAVPSTAPARPPPRLPPVGTTFPATSRSTPNELPPPRQSRRPAFAATANVREPVITPYGDFDHVSQPPPPPPPPLVPRPDHSIPAILRPFTPPAVPKTARPETPQVRCDNDLLPLLSTRPPLRPSRPASARPASPPPRPSSAVWPGAPPASARPRVPAPAPAPPAGALAPGQAGSTWQAVVAAAAGSSLAAAAATRGRAIPVSVQGLNLYSAKAAACTTLEAVLALCQDGHLLGQLLVKALPAVAAEAGLGWDSLAPGTPAQNWTNMEPMFRKLSFPLSENELQSLIGGSDSALLLELIENVVQLLQSVEAEPTIQ